MVNSPQQPDIQTSPDVPPRAPEPRRPASALLGYVILLLAIVVVSTLLVLAVGERIVVGRIVWLGVGVLLGGLWTLRARLPMLNASNTPIAVSGWLGLVLTSMVAGAVAPASLSAPVWSNPTRAAPAPNQQAALRPAPPTAVRRTGTLVPANAGSEPPRVASAAEAAAAVGPSPSPGLARPAAPTPVLPPAFDPQQYLGQGNAYDCADLASQAEAQAILRADPTDPNVIDNDRDGIACESNPPPRDTRRVARPGR